MSITNPEDIKNLPNFDMSIRVSQRILQLKTKIKTCVIIVSLENETCGSVIVGEQNLSEQAKINALLQTMSKLNIPFKTLQKYGNVDASQINIKGKEDEG